MIRRQTNRLSPLPVPSREIREGREARGGFTLIEMSVVILLIAFLFSIVVPQFRARTHSDLKSSAMKLAATIEHTFHQSAFRQETFRLHYDLDSSSYWLDRFVDPASFSFEELDDSGSGDFDSPEADFDGDENGGGGAYYVVDRTVVGETVILPVGIHIVSVTTQYFDETSEGEAFTHFFPDGYVEPTVIYLADRSKEYFTLYVSPISGKVKVLPGYHEFEVDMKEDRA